MKIINYSDKNLFLKDNEIDSKEFFIPVDYINNLKHNGQFIGGATNPPPDWTHMIITNSWANGYQYEKFNYTPPPVYEMIFIIITYFGLFFTIKLIQKIKSN